MSGRSGGHSRMSRCASSGRAGGTTDRAGLSSDPGRHLLVCSCARVSAPQPLVRNLAALLPRPAGPRRCSYGRRSQGMPGREDLLPVRWSRDPGPPWLRPRGAGGIGSRERDDLGRVTSGWRRPRAKRRHAAGARTKQAPQRDKGSRGSSSMPRFKRAPRRSRRCRPTARTHGRSPRHDDGRCRSSRQGR
jgi:hypothetical protein